MPNVIFREPANEPLKRANEPPNGEVEHRDERKYDKHQWKVDEMPPQLVLPCQETIRTKSGSWVTRYIGLKVFQRQESAQPLQEGIDGVYVYDTTIITAPGAWAFPT